ncbi:hypothetical protein E9229_001349 [Paeniglutamicibacter cryotolerans]|uniref:Uncharacterized protein n=1 Tax=Paeniglutamicibacter cryotolerans TaxID=670079 RepID=A0A839QFT9_9MICC|nr:hypothetical protein [Paeniglutamicibacter cryotolerans]
MPAPVMRWPHPGCTTGGPGAPAPGTMRPSPPGPSVPVVARCSRWWGKLSLPWRYCMSPVDVRRPGRARVCSCSTWLPERIALRVRGHARPRRGLAQWGHPGSGAAALDPAGGGGAVKAEGRLVDQGSIWLASLDRGPAGSDACLKLLRAHGDIARVRTAGELDELALDAGIGTVSVRHAGSMAHLAISRGEPRPPCRIRPRFRRPPAG